MGRETDVLVGRRLRRRRRLMGLSQQQLGAACGLGFYQVQAYETGASPLPVAMLWDLACALEVDIGYFFVDLPRAIPAGEARPRSAANAA
ncbi:MAG: helix-turn-helix domain-containing protein [Pseudomonadota bacterium]